MKVLSLIIHLFSSSSSIFSELLTWLINTRAHLKHYFLNNFIYFIYLIVLAFTAAQAFLIAASGSYSLVAVALASHWGGGFGHSMGCRCRTGFRSHSTYPRSKSGLMYKGLVALQQDIQDQAWTQWPLPMNGDSLPLSHWWGT